MIFLIIKKLSLKTTNHNNISQMPIHKSACTYRTDGADGKKYIGSTPTSTDRRLKLHECNFRRFNEGKYGYTTSFDIIKDGEYTINIVEEFINISRDELLRKEGEYIKNIDCINKVIAGNKMSKSDRGKEYYKRNKIIMDEKFKTYRENNKEKIKEYRDKNRCNYDKEKTRIYNEKYQKINKNKLELVKKNKIIKKLNNDEFKRTPLLSIKKHNIIFNKNTGEYE